jgi:hypothetical protein
MDLRNKSQSINSKNEWLFRFRWPLLIAIVVLYFLLDSSVISVVIDKAVEAKLKVNLFFQSDIKWVDVNWKEHLLLLVPSSLFVLIRAVRVHFIHAVFFVISFPVVFFGLSFAIVSEVLSFGLLILPVLGLGLHLLKFKRHWIFLLALPAIFLGFFLVWNIIVSQTAFQIPGAYLLLSLASALVISEVLALAVRTSKMIVQKDYKNGGLLAALKKPWEKGAWVLMISLFSTGCYLELGTDYRLFLLRAMVIALVAVWFVADLFFPIFLSIMPFDKFSSKSK